LAEPMKVMPTVSSTANGSGHEEALFSTYRV
jgi:hypothetical protein